VIDQKELLEEERGHVLFVPVLVRDDEMKQPHLTEFSFVPLLILLHLVAFRKTYLVEV
jgi:hypothetical protein